MKSVRVFGTGTNKAEESSPQFQKSIQRIKRLWPFLLRQVISMQADGILFNCSPGFEPSSRYDKFRKHIPV